MLIRQIRLGRHCRPRLPGAGACPGAAGGRLRTAHLLLRHVRCTDSSGCTALHWAARCGDLDAVRMLLRAGAPVGVRNAAGRNCVHCAAMGGSGPVVLAVLDAALRAPRPCRGGAERGRAGEEWGGVAWGGAAWGGAAWGGQGEAPGEGAAAAEAEATTAAATAEVGPDGWDAVARPEPLVHARDVNGVTPAEMAVRKGSADALRVLLAHGACGQRVWGLAVTLGNGHVLAVLDEWARQAA